ncbi:putative cyanamide hydratase [Actinokineospora spheciospongiae]|uniref:Putative cyanamide hydratase n=1 Tax=Actinokineospora spheciospongiae TaxID=909613 RepID=W7ISN6_9PSEU|nr:HD domain-containing protein [Actinokineospora spheciospongiae]EWC59742.1 putative cyanamide hydratase [Actinokineospora spheciospongiae]
MTTSTPGLSLPDLLSSPLRQAAVDHVLAAEERSVAHHSLRSYLFATKAADLRGLRSGVDYDDDTLFYATVLHDLGLSDEGEARPDRFEVAGADLAAEFLTGHGIAAEVVDTVWDAIALHTSPGITTRRGVVCDLTHVGTGLDFGHNADDITDEEAAVINDAFPRLDINTSIGRQIVEQAERNRGKAPHLSAADYFHHAIHGFDMGFVSRWGAA